MAETTDIRICTSLEFGVAVWTRENARTNRFTRIEQKVVIAVVKRTVFDDRSLSTINSADT